MNLIYIENGQGTKLRTKTESARSTMDKSEILSYEIHSVIRNDDMFIISYTTKIACANLRRLFLNRLIAYGVGTDSIGSSTLSSCSSCSC